MLLFGIYQITLWKERAEDHVNCFWEKIVYSRGSYVSFSKSKWNICHEDGSLLESKGCAIFIIEDTFFNLAHDTMIHSILSQAMHISMFIQFWQYRGLYWFQQRKKTTLNIDNPHFKHTDTFNNFVIIIHGGLS